MAGVWDPATTPTNEFYASAFLYFYLMSKEVFHIFHQSMNLIFLKNFFTDSVKVFVKGKKKLVKEYEDKFINMLNSLENHIKMFLTTPNFISWGF